MPSPLHLVVCRQALSRVDHAVRFTWATSGCLTQSADVHHTPAHDAETDKCHERNDVPLPLLAGPAIVGNSVVSFWPALPLRVRPGRLAKSLS